MSFELSPHPDGVWTHHRHDHITPGRVIGPIVGRIDLPATASSHTRDRRDSTNTAAT